MSRPVFRFEQRRVEHHSGACVGSEIERIGVSRHFSNRRLRIVFRNDWRMRYVGSTTCQPSQAGSRPWAN